VLALFYLTTCKCRKIEKKKREKKRKIAYAQRIGFGYPV
jgi:hypothetical protein